MSERQKAAARANGARSKGPVSLEGRESVRTAHLRHGLFSQAKEIVLPALGEDTARFEELRQGIDDAWPGADAALREELVAANWRLDRATRIVEELGIDLEMTLSAEGVDAWEQAYTSPQARRFRSMEACAFRDFMGILNRLLEDGESRERPPARLTPESIENKRNDRRWAMNRAQLQD